MRGSRQLRITLLLLLLSAFTLTALDFSLSPTGPLGALRRGIDTVIGPVQRTVGGAAGSAGRALGDLPRLGSYQTDNRRLQRENDALQAQLRETASLRCEAKEWTSLLGLQLAAGYTLLPAHVTSVGAAFGFEQTAVLDAGSRDGVRPDMPVVTGRGLVGRIKEVAPYTTTVLLLTDPQVQVGSRLGPSAALGTTSGHGSGPMTFQLQGQRPSLHRGDTVVTSGSTTYPPGIPIGTLSLVLANPDALTRSAQVVPFVDTSALDLVGIITNGTRTAPRRPLAPPRTSPAGVPFGTCSPPSPTRPSPTAPVRPAPGPSRSPSSGVPVPKPATSGLAPTPAPVRS